MRRFASELFAETFSEILVEGNVNAEISQALARAIEPQVAIGSALPLESRTVQARADLEGTSWLLATKHPNPDEVDGAVLLWLQLGQLSLPADAAASIVLGELLDQPFFTQLRTEQQLGYIVQAKASSEREHWFLRFRVQSSKSPTTVSDSIHAFVDSIGKLLASSSRSSFDGIVRSMSAELLEPPKSLQEVGDSDWQEIVSGAHRFHRREDLAAALQALQPQHVLQLWRNVSARSGGVGGRFLVQVYGSKPRSGRPSSFAAFDLRIIRYLPSDLEPCRTPGGVPAEARDDCRDSKVNFVTISAQRSWIVRRRFGLWIPKGAICFRRFQS